MSPSPASLSLDVMFNHATPRILVLGDVMLDRYVIGSAGRVSPEAPILVLNVEEERAVLGGAGNVAHNIAKLGGHVTLIGLIGNDQAGVEINTLIAGMVENGISIDNKLVTRPGAPTTVKTRMVSGSHQLLRVDRESTAIPDSAAVTALLDQFSTSLMGVDVVVLSDYAKGVLCDAVLESVIKQARNAGKLVLCDPKRSDFTAYRDVDVLTPNLAEVTRSTGIVATDDVGAEAAARKALALTQGKAILLTRSEKGMTLIERDRPVLHLRARAQEVVDVSGAGDTVLATLAVALGAGLALDDAAFLANVAASLAVAKVGTAAVTRDELVNAVHRRDLLATDQKLATLPQAVEQARQWRASGLRVGFTNGCFDLVHPGHVSLLAQARRACDRLIVGLNSDDSIKRLKGPTRPIQNELARALVMASMAAVDLVVLFSEDTPIDLIEALVPNILVKGGDYRKDQVVGADLVEAAGGAVILVDLEAGHSTTGTIARVFGNK